MGVGGISHSNNHSHARESEHSVLNFVLTEPKEAEVLITTHPMPLASSFLVSLTSKCFMDKIMKKTASKYSELGLLMSSSIKYKYQHPGKCIVLGDTTQHEARVLSVLGTHSLPLSYNLQFEDVVLGVGQRLKVNMISKILEDRRDK